MAAVPTRHRRAMDEIRELLALQSGVVSRQQARAAGLAEHDLRRLLRRRELVQVHRGVYIDHTGTSTWLQRAWAEVLYAWPAVLSHDSALRAADGPGRREDDSFVIQVAVDRHRHLAGRPGLVIHRVTRFEERASWNLSPPRMGYADSALDVALSAGSDTAALAVLARACQTRRTTAVRMLDALAARERSPRRQWLEGVLGDLRDGACSVLEWGYLNRVERAHGLPRAERQRRVVATLGLTYRDAQFRTLVIELDGRLFHDTATQRDRDMDRDLDAAVAGEAAIRLSYGQVFDRPCATAARVGVLLQRHGWSGQALPCGPDCTVRWPAATG